MTHFSCHFYEWVKYTKGVQLFCFAKLKHRKKNEICLIFLFGRCNISNYYNGKEMFTRCYLY